MKYNLSRTLVAVMYLKILIIVSPILIGMNLDIVYLLYSWTDYIQRVGLSRNI